MSDRIKLAPPRRRPRRIAKKIARRFGAKHHRDWVVLYIQRRNIYVIDRILGMFAGTGDAITHPSPGVTRVGESAWAWFQPHHVAAPRSVAR